MSEGRVAALRKLALLGAMERSLKISSAEFARVLETSLQTASRRLQDLEKDGLIHRDIVADGQWVVITEKGIELLKSEFEEYQRIFSKMEGGESVELVGSVMSGLGEGRYYVSQEGYKRQFREKLGFVPFPGTLNLLLRDHSVALRRRLDLRSGIKIEGFTAENRTFGGSKCFFCEILRDGCDDVKCAVVIPERTHYPENVIEIISPVNLRERLGLKDGDELRVRVILS
ncbi:MAG: Archaeal CTP-dependent riboflavin kinase [Candidatus Alkanophagales archaeon MCA70_species_1]|nr:Archaeal CTP-dependent riboflavin kinase [Candidatus Alkanophaga volatiphilum]